MPATPTFACSASGAANHLAEVTEAVRKASAAEGEIGKVLLVG